MEEAKLTAGDAAAGDNFGLSVSVSGEVAVVEAGGDDDAGSNSGSAYVYRFDPVTSAWIEEAKLTASDPAADDKFGGAIGGFGRFLVGGAVSVSGDVAVVGASENDGRGAAYVYRFDGSGWVEEAKLTASDGAAFDSFGVSVSVSGDVAVVGAIARDSRGAAYVYRFDPVTSAWIEEAKLTACDPATFGRFGISVSVSGDVAIIGATDHDDAGSNSGSGYVYRFDPDTSAWVQETKLSASDAAAGDRFGFSVSISGDIALVGVHLLSGDSSLLATHDHRGEGFGSGWAYVFDIAAVDRQIEVSLLTVDFGGVPLGSATTQIVTITNIGFADLTVSALNLSGAADFSLVAPPSVPLVLCQGQSQDVTVEFAPQALGLGSATLEILSDDDDTPSVVVTLTGEGVPADPVDLLLDLIDAVMNLNLQQGIENSLDVKLDAALHALEDINQNNNVAAVNTLQAFINAVKAQSGNQIPQEQADALIADALEIIALLGGA